MAFSPRIKGLFLAGSLSVSLLVAVQEAAEAEPVVASYYGAELAGNPTASGEPFAPEDLTAAHPYLPFGTLLTVSNNGRSVNVRVNDRGPFVAGRGLDLSLGSARAIGLVDSGAATVEVEAAETPQVKLPIPESTAPEQPGSHITSLARTTPSAEAQEREEHHGSLSENTLLTPPGERIVDSMGHAPSPRPHEVDAHHAGTAPLEAPSATGAPEAREDRTSQTLHVRPAVPGRRKGEPHESVA